ncbi:MAG: Flp pilus assembly complex ATPase component TadA [Ardenticatenaceae bacterium]|nr:Flp pilus assembly complex ATPase component TadA [Anaerolineales bacterium]MCB8920548.1 Flp pilus assembly complex ATPase component TadA [Ardenticatenaceae bacterium]MCB8990171.1 Flp pilus assembly complex ATPase component TadA [Ardenticatenaceae bacterium]MCB9003038.1 Flp pilus assembly complex ATPase component TadA [Ardenticatenaceae bacterium]
MTDIISASPRSDVQARFPDGRAFNGPVGSTIEAFVKAADWQAPGVVVAALLNGRLRELSRRLHHDADIVPITTADSDGVRIYRRSLSFLLIAAAAQLFPKHTISIHHSMPFGGYYCERDDQQPLDPAELGQLHRRMRDLVLEDLPISQVKVSLDEALELFRQSGDMEKADLFAKRRKDYLTLYELNGVRDYFHGFMVPRTGYLELFDIRPYNRGFILQFPRRRDPDILQPFEDEPRLAGVFQDYEKWLQIIGVPSVASLNNVMRNGRIREALLVAEALHEQQLATIANQIANRQPDAKIVLISGPTSAGKTTFSKRLALQLLAHGIRPVTISMDNYFVNRDNTPRDENGDYDFESLEAVDVHLFQGHLKKLLAGETIIQPVYNFHTGMREQGSELHIGADHVLIIEGIHGLNPRLVEELPPQSLYRIFISALTQLNLDKHNRVPTTDTRLLRRIVRDAAHRGYTAADTIARWPSVRVGEKRHIFPNQNNADVFFNSALVYEVAALKTLAYPLLLQVEPDTPERIEANRLRAFLQWFDPLPSEYLALIPTHSILREFLGGSVLDDYKPGQR